MKKVLIISISVIAVLASSYFLLINSKSHYNSVYLVPSNAILIAETQSPKGTWESLVHSQAWNSLGKLKSFDETNQTILKSDSIIASNSLLSKLLGNKSITVSVHPLSRGELGNLVILDLGKAAKIKNLSKSIVKVLGDDYTLNWRQYKEHRIHELHDRKSSEMYYYVFIKQKLVFSFDHTLIEACIDEQEDFRIGRDPAFLAVYKKISRTGDLQIYLQHSQLPQFYSIITGEKNEFVETLSERLEFTAFSARISQEGGLDIHGYAMYDSAFMQMGSNFEFLDQTEPYALPILPDRIASMVKLNFEDAHTYVTNAVKNIGQNEYESYQANLKKIEKKLKVNLDEQLFSWMEKEIIVIQTRPSNLGRDNEFAAILKSKNKKDHIDNLRILEKQIKKNSPVKFKAVDYRGYQIHYLSFPGLLKALFGKTLARIDKPYYTIIDKYVLMSSHPQTIKNLIDDYEEHKTLANKPEFKRFVDEFDSKCHLFAYVNIPTLYENLRAFLSDEKWQEMEENKAHLMCFQELGILAGSDDGLLHFNLKTKYNEGGSALPKLMYDNEDLLIDLNLEENEESSEIADTLKHSKILTSNLDAFEHVQYHANGEVQIEVELKNALLHGSFKEYYASGELKIKGKFKKGDPSGTWKYYNQDGDLIKTEDFD